jgi:hypothetical protein
VSYTYNGDLGGNFPGLLRRAAWKGEVVELFAGLNGEVKRRASGTR